jgi:hypothetical protein
VKISWFDVEDVGAGYRKSARELASSANGSRAERDEG